jgi:hypothetical protein
MTTSLLSAKQGVLFKLCQNRSQPVGLVSSARMTEIPAVARCVLARRSPRGMLGGKVGGRVEEVAEKARRWLAGVIRNRWTTYVMEGGQH